MTEAKSNVQAWQWDGTSPDDLTAWIREELGPGHALCIWGGMEWSFKVKTPTGWRAVGYGDWLFVGDGKIEIGKGKGTP
jgi:hypothetical protein